MLVVHARVTSSPCCWVLEIKEGRDRLGAHMQGFFKETPTYQQDLNESLLVSSAALLYSVGSLDPKAICNTHIRPRHNDPHVYKRTSTIAFKLCVNQK
jgi:hypothetical protein